MLERQGSTPVVPSCRTSLPTLETEARERAKAIFLNGGQEGSGVRKEKQVPRVHPGPSRGGDKTQNQADGTVPELADDLQLEQSPLAD